MRLVLHHQNNSKEDYKYNQKSEVLDASQKKRQAEKMAEESNPFNHVFNIGLSMNQHALYCTGMEHLPLLENRYKLLRKFNPITKLPTI